MIQLFPPGTELDDTDYQLLTPIKKKDYTVPGYVYLLKYVDNKYKWNNSFKIGKAENIQRRLKKYKYKVKLLHTIFSNDYDYAEVIMHREYLRKLVNCSTENFLLNKNDIKKIKKIKSILITPTESGFCAIYEYKYTKVYNDNP